MAICIRWFSVRMLADIFIELSGLGLISARSLFPWLTSGRQAMRTACQIIIGCAVPRAFPCAVPQPFSRRSARAAGVCLSSLIRRGDSRLPGVCSQYRCPRYRGIDHATASGHYLLHTDKVSLRSLSLRLQNISPLVVIELRAIALIPAHLPSFSSCLSSPALCCLPAFDGDPFR